MSMVMYLRRASEDDIARIGEDADAALRFPSRKTVGIGI